MISKGLIECQDGDLNSGHEDFQSSALPTELSRLEKLRFSSFIKLADLLGECKQFLRKILAGKDGDRGLCSLRRIQPSAKMAF